VQHGIKINLEKCIFASKEVSYLGFRLTEEGVKPGPDKLRVVKEARPPESVREVRQFLGLCNFFRAHVRNFAQVSAPLTALTKKECSWKKGALPPEALKAFRELQSYLCSEPVVAYPRRDRPYALITDAALGDDQHPGGLGAILTQMTPDGEHHVIAYASRKLQKHEKNYTPFLLEMQAALWGMDHFCNYLKGRHFTLFTDHKPLEKLEKRHTRTLNRLQEAMNIFDFEVVYKKGSEMPADFLSRNIAVLSWDSKDLSEEQGKDPFIGAMKEFLLHKELPKDEKCRILIKHFSDECFLENDIVWRRIKRKGEIDKVVILLPETQIQNVLKEAHGHLLSGHDGLLKTKERVSQCYYWPGMDKDIQDHLHSCHKCQIRKTNHLPSPHLLTPLPQPTEPNQRIHADLFGPLKCSGNNKKYILCMTDAFTKYVELVAIDNKEAPTVGQAIFEKWICRYGIPLDVITDQGTEFCNQLAEDLYGRLEVSHLRTSPYHPACNSQAEVANKTIAKYLSSMVSDNTLDWELYIAPLMFSYNTSFHRSVKNTPHFLTFGLEARLPSFLTTDLRRKFYGETASDEMVQRLLYARDLARRHNEESSEQYRHQFDKKANPHSYQPQQLVLLDEHSFLHKNAKLAPNWSGPHRILRLKGDTNVELQLRNGRKLVVHVNRLKPYVVPREDISSPNLEKKKKTAKEPVDKNDLAKPPDVQLTVEDRYLPPLMDRNLSAENSLLVFPPTFADSAGPPPLPALESPVRRRGRPPRNTRHTPAPNPAPPPVEHRYPLRRLQPALEFPDGLDTNTVNEPVTLNDVDDLNLNPVRDLRKQKRKPQPYTGPWQFPHRHYITPDHLEEDISQPAALDEPPAHVAETDSESELSEDSEEEELWWDPEPQAEVPGSPEGTLSPDNPSPISSPGLPLFSASSSDEENTGPAPRPPSIPSNLPSTASVASQPSSTRSHPIPAAPTAVRQRSRTVDFDPATRRDLRARSRSVSRQIHATKPDVLLHRAVHPAPATTTRTSKTFGDYAAARLFGGALPRGLPDAQATTTTDHPSATAPARHPEASSSGPTTRSRGPAENSGLTTFRKPRQLGKE
jgi:hypothetical protein